MERVKYKNDIYNIADIINFEGTYHLIIISGEKVNYINKDGNHYYEAPTDLTIYDKSSESLTNIRKQHILKMLLDYITSNNMYGNIKDVTAAFKEYIKTSYIKAFLYWPYMTDTEALKELKSVKNNLEKFMNEKLHNRVLAPDNETIIIIDNYVSPVKFLPEEDFIKDPSFKK